MCVAQHKLGIYPKQFPMNGGFDGGFPIASIDGILIQTNKWEVPSCSENSWICFGHSLALVQSSQSMQKIAMPLMASYLHCTDSPTSDPNPKTLWSKGEFTNWDVAKLKLTKTSKKLTCAWGITSNSCLVRNSSGVFPGNTGLAADHNLPTAQQTVALGR